MLQLYFEFLDQSITKRLQPVDNEEAPAAPRNNDSISHHSPVTIHNAAAARDFTVPAEAREQTFSNFELYSGRQSIQARHRIDGLDFASDLFSSQEAEDFSMFQLQPDLFAGDMFGGGLDHYYNFMIPRTSASAEDL